MTSTPTTTTSISNTNATTLIKSVRFNDNNNKNGINYHFTLHISDYTKSEIKKCWYSKQEYRSIRADCDRLVRLMETSTGKVCENDAKEICYRGLEHRLQSRGIHRKGFNVARANEVVMEEQFRQWCEGINDPELFSQVYQNIAWHCQQMAQWKGQRDAAMAKFIHEQQDEKEKSVPEIIMKIKKDKGKKEKSNNNNNNNQNGGGEVITTSKLSPCRIIKKFCGVVVHPNTVTK